MPKLSPISNLYNEHTAAPRILFNPRLLGSLCVYFLPSGGSPGAEQPNARMLLPGNTENL